MVKEDITTFAPVIIPTLCRYEHFKRCIESLSRCTWAEYTEVYVALDYPAKESHWEGYKKIKAYLETCGNMTFKSLHVIQREKNYGFGPNGNAYSLIREIWEKYDRRIGSEDDNEFSPNFLVYMNKALEKFKNDEKVLNISAYSPKEFQNITTDYYYAIDSPAYGMGVWKHKENYFRTKDNIFWKSIATSSFLKLLKCFILYPGIIHKFITMIKKNDKYGDVIRSFNNLYFHTATICPTLSLSRNWGADGSGIHSRYDPNLSKLPISQEKDFDFMDVKFGVTTSYKKKLFFRNMPHNKFIFIIKFIGYFFEMILFYISCKITSLKNK